MMSTRAPTSPRVVLKLCATSQTVLRFSPTVQYEWLPALGDTTKRIRGTASNAPETIKQKCYKWTRHKVMIARYLRADHSRQSILAERVEQGRGNVGLPLVRAR